MALYALLSLIALACLRGLARWRDGLFLMALIAAVQDPLRKLVPGAPGYLTLATMPVLIVILFTLISTQRVWWRAYARTFPDVSKAIMIFIIACIPAAILSATYGPGSWMLTLLGAFSYGVLLLAIILGFHFPRSVRDLRRLLGFYCIVSSVMLTGGLIEYLDLWPGTRVLGTEALGMQWVRYSQGFTVDLIAGFYRSPDVMGWHAAAVTMLALILALTTTGRARWFWIAVSVTAVVALLLCGRRKMVYMLPAFIVAATWLYWQAGRHMRKMAILGILLFPLASVAVVSDWLGGDESAHVRYYSEDPGDTLDQLYRHGFQSLLATYRQAGFFGSGLGVATPGSHHLPVARPRAWQESGPSRVLVELGVPGMLALLGVVATILLAGWRVTRRHLRAKSPVAGYAVGLLAFFLANIGSLVVSGQILADPFIAAFIGLSIGLVLSLARVPVPVRVSAPITPDPLGPVQPGRA